MPGKPPYWTKLGHAGLWGITSFTEQERGAYQAVGEEDPTERTGTKRTFPTAFGRGSAVTRTAHTWGQMWGLPREKIRKQVVASLKSSTVWIRHSKADGQPGEGEAGQGSCGAC